MLVYFGKVPILFCLFGFILYVTVNSYGHVKTVISPSHTFLGKLEQAINQYLVHIRRL